MIKEVHESEKRDLLPGEHLVDKGYTDSRSWSPASNEYGVTIVGPVAEDPSWQARRRGLRQGELRGGLGPSGGDLPGGQGEHLLAPEHLPEERHGLRGAVRAEGLHAVSARGRGAHESKKEPRIIGLLPREQHEALQAGREHRGRRSSGRGTRRGRGSRGLMNKRSAGAVYGGAAISERRRRICSTS